VTTRLEVLEAEALKLTDSERAALAQRLLASLDENAEVEEAWAAEVKQRIAAVERGEVQDIPIAEALVTLRTGLE
jgi:putative addiction module component (TIGR02574 family)